MADITIRVGSTSISEDDNKKKRSLSRKWDLLVWPRVTLSRVSRAAASVRIQRPINPISCVDSSSLDTNYLHPISSLLIFFKI